ncbi:OmpH family outer membrane protein [Rhodocytophaga aerolata]|uniref:OmpH family outer membrane protein n=1 Tax=Rhodocytophaga aerolata TaxID=455078 RepID=A0ABT8RAU9_9BACT|nr:OmpH family outer membrane protein [Rhodocytophaga aerolata]MDO1448811.1 OmpH family outer membrane protein [Rhodocytophaga aerolata]
MNKVSFGIILAVLFSVCSILPLQAQKFGYIDTDFILSKMPDATKAQSEIEAFASKWQREIQAKYDEVNQMEQDFRAEEILLTDEMRSQRLLAIEQKKKEVSEYNNKVFGFEGMLYLKKKELMQPLRDQIYEAVQKVVKTRKLEFMFDKAADLVMIYSDPRHDYSDYILEELGLAENKDGQGPASQTSPSAPPRAGGAPVNKN